MKLHKCYRIVCTKCNKFHSWYLFKIRFFSSFLYFPVSDFTDSLAQLYEKHAEELQALVSNYRKKNGELRKEVRRETLWNLLSLTLIEIFFSISLSFYVIPAASSMSIEPVSCLGDFSAGGRSWLTINKWTFELAFKTGKLWWYGLKHRPTQHTEQSGKGFIFTLSRVETDKNDNIVCNIE